MVIPIGTALKDACPECGGPMVLKSSKHGLFWGCTDYPRCRGTHGAHPDGRPLGKPADKPTRAARVCAHAEFDKLWKGGGMSRKAAYRWMRKEMGLNDDTGHIALFSIEQCEDLIELCKRRP